MASKKPTDKDIERYRGLLVARELIGEAQKDVEGAAQKVVDSISCLNHGEARRNLACRLITAEVLANDLLSDGCDIAEQVDRMLVEFGADALEASHGDE